MTTFKKIVDISLFNTVNSVRELANDCDAIIVRLGYRGSSSGKLVLDYEYERVIAEVIKCGVPWGVYFVTQAVTAAEASEEAVFCIKYLMNLNRENMVLGVFLDSEYSPNKTGRADALEKGHRTAIANCFFSKLFASGYKNYGIYCSSSWAKTNLAMDNLNEHAKKWIARYSVNEPDVEWDYWQHTSKGSVAGVSGNVDLSRGKEKKDVSVNPFDFPYNWLKWELENRSK